MWKPEHRRAAERQGLRYPSDLTAAEWALVEPMIPPAKRGGRPRDVNVREVLNAVFYLLSTGCQWDALPKDLPAKSTVYDYFALWRSDRTLLQLHQAGTDDLFIQHHDTLNFYGVTGVILKHLRQINHTVKNLDQIRASVITHWVQVHDLRKAQYLAGHRHVSSTEAYKQQLIDELQADVKKFHPF